MRLQILGLLIRYRYLTLTSLEALSDPSHTSDVSTALEALQSEGLIETFPLREGSTRLLPLVKLVKSKLTKVPLQDGLTEDERRGRAPKAFLPNGLPSVALRKWLGVQILMRDTSDFSAESDLVPSRLMLTGLGLRGNLKRNSPWVADSTNRILSLLSIRTGSSKDNKLTHFVREACHDLGQVRLQPGWKLRLVVGIDRPTVELAALQEKFAAEPRCGIEVLVRWAPANTELALTKAMLDQS